MKPENLTELNDQELLQKIKGMKNNKIIDASAVGFTIGIVVFSAVKNGFTFFTFFPLILTYLIVRNSKRIRFSKLKIKNKKRYGS